MEDVSSGGAVPHPWAEAGEGPAGHEPDEGLELPKLDEDPEPWEEAE